MKKGAIAGVDANPFVYLSVSNDVPLAWDRLSGSSAACR